MTICTLAFAQTGTEMMQRPIEVSQYRDRTSKAFKYSSPAEQVGMRRAHTLGLPH